MQLWMKNAVSASSSRALLVIQSQQTVRMKWPRFMNCGCLEGGRMAKAVARWLLVSVASGRCPRAVGHRGSTQGLSAKRQAGGRGDVEEELELEEAAGGRRAGGRRTGLRIRTCRARRRRRHRTFRSTCPAGIRARGSVPDRQWKRGAGTGVHSETVLDSLGWRRPARGCQASKTPTRGGTETDQVSVGWHSLPLTWSAAGIFSASTENPMSGHKKRAHHHDPHPPTPALRHPARPHGAGRCMHAGRAGAACQDLGRREREGAGPATHQPPSAATPSSRAQSAGTLPG